MQTYLVTISDDAGESYKLRFQADNIAHAAEQAEPYLDDTSPPIRMVIELVTAAIVARLEALRAALRAENISYGELAELQSLAAYIAPGDVELLEAAGVPEGDIS